MRSLELVSFLFITITVPLLALGEEIHIYVWDFSTRSEEVNSITESLTSDFERALLKEGCATVLSRRNYGRLLAQRRGEESILGISDLTYKEQSELKTINADGVVFGEIYDDTESGELLVSTTAEKFNSETIASAQIRFRRGLRFDSQTRQEEMEALAKRLCASLIQSQERQADASPGPRNILTEYRNTATDIKNQKPTVHSEIFQWPYTERGYPGKILTATSKFAMSANFSVPYDPAKGLWEYGMAIFQHGDDCFQLLVRSDQSWRLIRYNPRDAEVLQAGQLPSIVTEDGGINKTTIVVLEDHAFLNVNGLETGPIPLSKGPALGRSVLIVGFEEENPAIRRSIFSVQDIRLWELPGGSQYEEASQIRGTSTNRPTVPREKKGILTSSGEIRATGFGTHLKNFWAEATFTPTSPSTSLIQIGFIFRYSAKNDYCQLTVDHQGRWILQRKTLNSQRILDSGQLSSTTVSNDQSTHLKLEVRNGSMILIANSNDRMTAKIPPPYLAGDVAVIAQIEGLEGSPGVVQFEDFRARKIDVGVDQ